MRTWEAYDQGDDFGWAVSDGAHDEIADGMEEEIAKQIVREHNAHADLVMCLKAMLKNDCGEFRGEKLRKSCYVEPEVCALSAQARAAVEAAK